jgi:hypothetical protein
MHQGTVVISALSGDLEVGVGVGKGLTTDAIAAGSQALAAAAADIGVRPQGARFKKEELLLGVLEKCPSLMLVGGGASHPDPMAPATYIFVNGEVITDGVLVVLIKTDATWKALRAHWYEPTGEHMRITKVDDTCRRALEIDGKPAAERYAEVLGVGIDDLEFGKPNGFANRPTAMKIRAAWKPLPDGSIVFANLLEEGSDLELMKLVDPVEATRKFFTDELPRQVPDPTAVVIFHCGGRAWFAEALGKTAGLSGSFASAPPCAGYNVLFEIYSGFQINTTLTVLAFGKNDA